jgi:hypothetical protein
MELDTDHLRAGLARIMLAGDFQELLNLYAGGDVALDPEAIDRVYPPESLPAEDREALAEIEAAIADDLLPPLDRRATVPAEMVELTARCALERGKDIPALRALREAESLDKFQRMYTTFAMESLEGGDDTRAAFELSLAGRLSWARSSPEARRDFVTGLGVNLAELATSLGAESARGRISGGRDLPDFPAWQTYGPLLHARCHVEPCVSDLPLDASVPLAVRFLLHDADLAERAIGTAGDALRLLRALAAELDPGLADFAERHAQAMVRYRELHDQRLIRDTRLAAEAKDESSETSTDEEQEAPPEEPAEGEEPEKSAEEERADKTAAAREGLQEVQSILLGRREPEWRNALAELAATHPLSAFTVCVVRGQELGGFVIPASEQAAQLLKAVV